MSEKIPIKVDPDLEDLIPGFLQNRHKDVERLGELIPSDSFDDLKMLGHSMKGVGGGYGFDEITAIGARIEQAADAGDRGALEKCAAELADYLARIEVVFED